MTSLGMGQHLQQRMAQEMRLNQFQQQSLHFLQSGVAELIGEIEELRKKYPELQWKEGQPGEWEQGNVKLKHRKRYPGEWRLENQWQNGRYLSSEELLASSDAKQQMLENHFSEEDYDSPELRETLREQIYLWNLKDEEREFCELVLQNLDERGLNIENPILIAATLLPKDATQKRKLGRLLRRIQQLEPAGCACDSPLQSLLVQAELRFPDSPLLRVLSGLSSLEVLGSLEDFCDYLQKCGLDKCQSENTLRDLRQLEPYPARGYRLLNHSLSFRIYPEIQVQLRENTGIIEVELLNSLGAKLEILDSGAQNDTQQRQRRQEAEMLLLQLQRREETLLRIAQTVFQLQQAFVIGGMKDLQVMSLQMVAEDLDMHVSTISRCIQGKYCKTPWGTYPLRFFFSQGARSGQSREQIKERILEILQEYTLSMPLFVGNKPVRRISDAELGKRLEKSGIQIARRTVAKYRAELLSEGRL